VGLSRSTKRHLLRQSVEKPAHGCIHAGDLPPPFPIERRVHFPATVAPYAQLAPRLPRPSPAFLTADPIMVAVETVWIASHPKLL
jgi:hypothetical protein